VEYVVGAIVCEKTQEIEAVRVGGVCLEGHALG
jgi:hypothetical protein